MTLPPQEDPQHNPAAQDQPDHRGYPQPLRSAGLSLDETPGPGPQNPIHDEAKAERGQHGAHEIEPRAFLGWRVSDAPGEPQDDEHNEDLTGEHPPPGGIGGQQAADQRPGRHGDRAGRGDQPVGARALITGEVRGDQRDDRGHDERGPDAFQD